VRIRAANCSRSLQAAAAHPTNNHHASQLTYRPGATQGASAQALRSTWLQVCGVACMPAAWSTGFVHGSRLRVAVERSSSPHPTSPRPGRTTKRICHYPQTNLSHGVPVRRGAGALRQRRTRQQEEPRRAPPHPAGGAQRRGALQAAGQRDDRPGCVACVDVEVVCGWFYLGAGLLLGGGGVGPGGPVGLPDTGAAANNISPGHPPGTPHTSHSLHLTPKTHSPGGVMPNIHSILLPKKKKGSTHESDEY